MEHAERPLAVSLNEAAATAGYAPSIHNTQPWRWRVLPDRLQLYADRSRQLAATDPNGRLLTLSCGAALHHARLALAAVGYACEVRRLPDPGQPDLLAELVPTERQPATATATRMVQTMQVRHTDRRPVSDEPVPRKVLDAIAGAMTGLARLHVLTPDQVLDLAAPALSRRRICRSAPSRSRGYAPVRRCGGLARRAGARRLVGPAECRRRGTDHARGVADPHRRPGWPYIAMRLGLADPAHAGPPHTPRMPAVQVIDTSQVRPPAAVACRSGHTTRPRSADTGREAPSLGLSPLSRVRLDELLQEMLDRVGDVVASRNGSAGC